MAFNFEKLAQGGLSGLTQGLASGNPKIALANAALQAVLGGVSGTDELDTSRFDRAFDKLERSTLARSRRSEAEIGAQSGSDLAARGVTGALASDLTTQKRGHIRQNALEQLSRVEAEKEFGIADLKLADDIQRDTASAKGWTELGSQVALFANDLLNPSDTESPGLASIREALGLQSAPAAPTAPAWTRPDGTTRNWNTESNVYKQYTSSDAYKGMYSGYAEATGMTVEELLELLGGF